MPFLQPRDPKITRAHGLSSSGTAYPTHLLILVIALGLVGFKAYEAARGIAATPVDRYIYALLAASLIGEFIFVALSGVRMTRLIEALAKLDNADPISGCYTGDALTSMVEREVARASRSGRSLAILMIDVATDGPGDAAPLGPDDIREMTRVIRESTRNSDVLGQFEPGELALILPDTPTDHAPVVASKLRQRFDISLSSTDPSRLGVKLVTARQAPDGKGIIWSFNESLDKVPPPTAAPVSVSLTL